MWLLMDGRVEMKCLSMLLYPTTPYWTDDADYMGGLTEEGVPLVGNLITSDCIVELYMSNPQ